jgi:serine-type D-Ala-D-Ala endopeptidase (penicillin-binding protein 7)
MNRLLTVVFVCLLAAGPAGAAEFIYDPAKLQLRSANVLVLDATADTAIYSKAADEVTPIASVTKLMTAVVVLDAQQSMDDPIEVDMDDFDFLKGSSSRLRMGTVLPRREMLRLALMASENRAASALARNYPGGRTAFVSAMNAKAQLLGMSRTHYSDSTGLSPENVSTANDLAKLVRVAADYPLIREFSTTPTYSVEIGPTGKLLGFNNSNGLVKNQTWDIQLQKTGYIREAGKCLVMLATIASKPMVIVLLDSLGQYTRMADAQRVKHWLETGEALPVQAAKAAQRGLRHAAAAVKAPKRGKGTFQPVAKAG